MIARISDGSAAFLLILAVVVATFAGAKCGQRRPPAMPPIGAEPPLAVPRGLPR